MSEIRNKTVHIAFSEMELSKIDKYCMYGELKLTTRTEFIRQAIFDKIRNKEHPQNTTSSVSNVKAIEKLDYLIELQETDLEISKLIKQKFTTINGIKNGYKSLKELISDKTFKENFKLKADKIQSVMKEANKPLNPKMIESKTDFDLKSIHLILTQMEKNKEIERNMNGRWVLK